MSYDPETILGASLSCRTVSLSQRDVEISVKIRYALFLSEFVSLLTGLLPRSCRLRRFCATEITISGHRCRSHITFLPPSVNIFLYFSSKISYFHRTNPEIGNRIIRRELTWFFRPKSPDRTTSTSVPRRLDATFIRQVLRFEYRHSAGRTGPDGSACRISAGNKFV